MLQTVSGEANHSYYKANCVLKVVLSIVTINSTTIIIAMDLQAMEIDEIVVLVDEVGCQSVVKIQKLIQLFVIIIMSADQIAKLSILLPLLSEH